MTTAPETHKVNNAQRWSNSTTFALERLPLPYPLLAALVGVITLAEQVLEYSFNDPTFRHLTAEAVARLFVLPIMTVYILIFLRILRGRAVKELERLRPTVLVSDEEYDNHVRRMFDADWRVELALLVMSVAIIVGLFVLLRWELLSATSALPAAWPAALFIVAVYVLFVWLLLSQVYCTVRHANGLRVMALRPLDINVFNQDNLLPFGRLSLLHTLPSIGFILIPLLILGMPTQSGYVVILLSLVGLLAFFVPLWGVHQQIDQAKERVLASTYQQFTSIQGALLQGTEAEMEDLDKLTGRIEKLIQLRKTIEASPEWPFRDSASFVRAIAAVVSPLLSFILNEILQTYVMPILQILGAS